MNKILAIMLSSVMPAMLAAMLLPATALAQAACSNMPPDFYPHPACVKPDEKTVGKSPGIQDQQAMLAYNLKVKNFNQRAAAFNLCLKTYIDNAQNDITAIQAMVHAAVVDANTR